MNGHEVIKAIENHNLDAETNVADVRLENGKVVIELVSYGAELEMDPSKVVASSPVQRKKR